MTFVGQAIQDLDRIIGRLKEIEARGTFTVGELRGIRTELLSLVRCLIDPWALGHAPEKRHY